MSVVPQGLKMLARTTANPVSNNTSKGRNLRIQAMVPRSGVIVADAHPMFVAAVSP